MTRRHLILGLALSLPSVCLAQAPAGWTKVPSVVVLGLESDARLPLVRDAVDFWNRVFAEIGSTFRLGTVTPMAGAIPADELKALSEQTLSQRGPVPLPESLRRWPGDLTVALSAADFISFARRWPSLDRALVAIKSDRAYPLSLPNVARNVIAHEIGHAIGLRHNSDPATLMCGRPAPCRPDAFQSATERYFPLTGDERAQLLALYPADWKGR
jgi:hypothetical protein